MVENPAESLSRRVVLRPASRQEWRVWLESHHSSESEAWLVLPKAGAAAAGRGGPVLVEAVEEALCFGWVDSALKPIDDNAYALRFSPRRPGSRWSKANVRRMRRLVGEGRMTPAGLAKIDPALLEREPEPGPEGAGAAVPECLAQALAASPAASERFELLPISQRFQHIHWIAEAKREETKLRRVAAVIASLEGSTLTRPEGKPPERR